MSNITVSQIRVTMLSGSLGFSLCHSCQTMRLDTRWEMASSKSAIAKLLEKVDGTAACKQGGRFLRPVDLQVVTCFLQGKQNFIQL